MPAAPGIFWPGQKGACAGSAVKTCCCGIPGQPVRPGAGYRQGASPVSKWVVSVSVVTAVGRSLGRRT